MFKPKKANQPKLTNRLKTMLEFSENWSMDQQERYVFQYYHNKLKGLDPNQINIHGVELHKTAEGFIMTAIIRHSLEKKLNLQDIRLVVRNTEGKELARKDFNMEYFGVLNSLRARPWIFEFENESLLVSEDEINDKMEFEVVFEIQEPAVSQFSLQLDENWSNGLNEEQKTSLENTLAEMEPTKQDEISVSAFNLEETEEGVSVYVLIRNAFNEEITISNLPLQLFDATGELVAQLGFPLEQFTVNPTNARPVSLHFPQSVFKKENPDWTSWNIQLTAQ
ncbi:SLAP domain-containing protein [Bacillus sp. FJAT-22090]|uniref:SLAP domain-containing protein n=1 Tax=Bacillus sp. FJAT-22090 TaxID=1581038 RepID=UPI00164243C2|nr:SLAP domain-containing protein [Bacillus sp. FJAT-22090]